MNLPRRSFLTRIAAALGFGAVGLPLPGPAKAAPIPPVKPQGPWRIEAWEYSSPDHGAWRGWVKLVVTNTATGSYMSRTVAWYAPTQTFIDGQLDARKTLLKWFDGLNGIVAAPSKAIKLDFDA